MRVFGVGSDVTQLTLSLFLLGYAVGQLVVGTLSDAVGRRPALLAGLGVYTVASLACAVTGNLWLLVTMRFVQGTGAAAGAVIGRAMVRDTHTGAEAARLLATMIAVLAIAPMVAPLVGGVLLEHLGWRAIFATLCLCGVALSAMAASSLEETLGERRALSLRAIASGFALFFGAKETRIPTLLVALSFAGQFAFISGSPFVIIQGYGVQPAHYGFYFGATALALMVGSASGGRLLKRGRSPQSVVRIGGAALMVAAVSLVALVHLPGTGVFGLIGPMILCFVGIGLVGPSATAIALDPVPEIAGSASAIIGGVQMIAGSLSGYVVAKIGGASPTALGWQVAIMAISCAMLAIMPRRGAA